MKMMLGPEDERLDEPRTPELRCAKFFSAEFRFYISHGQRLLPSAEVSINSANECDCHLTFLSFAPRALHRKDKHPPYRPRASATMTGISNYCRLN